MKQLLFNPFVKYAGFSSLLIGLFFLLATSVAASAFNVHLDGVIDLHIGKDVNFLTGISESLINWLAMALFIYLAGLAFSKSSIRLIDVMGTQAMARTPFLIATLANSLLSGSNIDKYLESKILKSPETVQISSTDIFLFAITIIVTIACLVWTILLMYRAYLISCNVKGSKATLSFIAALLLAEIGSKLLMYLIFK